MSASDFKYRIKSMRIENKISQDELASKLGLSRTAVSAYEVGRNEPPSDVLIKLSQIFGCSIDYLLGLTDDPYDYENATNNLARRIRALRIKNNLTQDELSQRMVLPPKMISFYELGERVPSRKSLIKLADIFDVSVEYLLGETNDTKSEKKKSDLCVLIKLAQGERSQNEYAMHCGIDAATITKTMNGEHSLSPETLRKLASQSHNGVTYEMLMEAAGYIDTENNKKNQTSTTDLTDIMGKDGLYLRLAKGAKDLNLDETDVNYILDFYKKYKK